MTEGVQRRGAERACGRSAADGGLHPEEEPQREAAELSRKTCRYSTTQSDPTPGPSSLCRFHRNHQSIRAQEQPAAAGGRQSAVGLLSSLPHSDCQPAGLSCSQQRLSNREVRQRAAGGLWEEREETQEEQLLTQHHTLCWETLQGFRLQEKDLHNNK